MKGTSRGGSGSIAKTSLENDTTERLQSGSKYDPKSYCQKTRRFYPSRLSKDVLDTLRLRG